MLGECEMVSETRIGDGDLVFFRGCKSSKAQTILLRGANDYLLVITPLRPHLAIG